ncbi:MAG: 1-deoxy-D-xylulose-5-phosphate synthase [Coriobacteriia bacterium]|nr:1-deoxy-D-xylulose-5-phosphate synthase [Coriobacteriia bacterium]
MPIEGLRVEKERILDRIEAPCDLRPLGVAELTRLAAEIREELITTVSRTGGHLAPNLGVVELTLGIHRALDCPKDRIIFDVGHQSYVHKLVTGRRDRFDSLRQYGGICGFPKRCESPLFDTFDTGHASDSISVGLGLALARDASGGDETVLIVIGDGSMTGGMSFEALNHLGHLGTRLVIVLNDNEMSISKNVGALARYLARVRLDRRYQRLRDGVESRLAVMPLGKAMVDAGEAVKDSVKQLLVPGMLFEELGLKYIGPIDGHDIAAVESAVRAAKRTDGPVLVHAATRKGAGYAHAEEQPDAFHGVGPFSVETGKANGGGDVAAISYTEAFSRALLTEAAANGRIVAITAAMPAGTGLDRFAERFPERFYDVGIAEGHAVGLAAGLALGGRIPVVAIYSTFMQRAYDQLITDVALQNLHVVFCLDRAGLVGEDGPTHHGVFSLTYLRSIPNLQVIAPADEAELAHALHTAVSADTPVALCYPRSATTGIGLPESCEVWEPGRAEVRRRGKDIALIGVGRMTVIAEAAAELLAAEGLDASIINARWVKPLDTKMILQAAGSHRLLATIEENVGAGGFGAAVAEVMADAPERPPLLRFAVPDCFVSHGATDILMKEIGITPENVCSAVLGRMQQLSDAGAAPDTAAVKAAEPIPVPSISSGSR